MKATYNPLNVSTRIGIYIIGILGILYLAIGSAGIVLSVTELFLGRSNIYHYNETQGGLTVENPLWPSSGKGFWVGLVFVATGFIGILASREWTPPSIVGFTVVAGVSTILSFYLVITCIIPVQYDATYSDLLRPPWQLTELTINSLLIVIGAFSAIIGTISTFIGCYFAECCISHRRKYPAGYNDPNRIIIHRSGGFGRGSPYVRLRAAVR
jgi:hypothetical protein